MLRLLFPETWLSLRYIVILIALLCVAFGITAPKVYKMAQVRGWLDGGTASIQTVTSRWAERDPAENVQAYWVGWTTADITKPGGHRINVTAERFSLIHRGDPIEIIRFPTDRHAYLRDGIFASTGNLIFDVTLFFVLLGTAGGIVVLLVGSSEAHRQP